MQAAEFEGMPQCYVQPMLPRADLFGPEQMTQLDAERLSKGVSQVQAAIIPKWKDFHSLLLNPLQRASIKTTVGEIAVPLGAMRLEIAHLITALLSSNNSAIADKLAELETIPILVVSKTTVIFNCWLLSVILSICLEFIFSISVEQLFAYSSSAYP